MLTWVFIKHAEREIIMHIKKLESELIKLNSDKSVLYGKLKKAEDEIKVLMRENMEKYEIIKIAEENILSI